MSTTVEVTFPWGRYHGTPWGHHVNEGGVDWPPAPWRVLRALYSTWRERAPDLPAATVEDLLGVLAEPPSYHLPPHLPSSTRHYYPDARSGSDLVIDSFVALERRAELLIHWEQPLDSEQRRSLSTLVDLLPYLGRAESICSARLKAPDEHIEPDGWLSPLAASSGDSTDLLAAALPLEIESLTEGVDTMRSKGHLQPRGARWLPYATSTSPTTQPQPRRRTRIRPTSVRWAISAPALPSAHLATAVGESLRSAAMSQYGRLFHGGTSATLAGKDANGDRLQGHHHAHYLPFDEDGDGLLDHIVAWVPGIDAAGIDDAALQALMAITDIRGRWSGPGIRHARLGVEGVGPVESTVPFLATTSRTWMSHTPFAPPRHWKGENFVERSVRRAAAERQLPEIVTVRRRDGDWLSYRRHRLRERLEDARRAVGLTITFDSPIRGPLCLGALSHFGLGLFQPAEFTRGP